MSPTALFEGLSTPRLLLDANRLDRNAARMRARSDELGVTLRTLKPLGSLTVGTVHQEHGTVPVPDETWFARLPIGSLVRVLPNHACLTCAAYASYDVLRTEKSTEQWPRIGGW